MASNRKKGSMHMIGPLHTPNCYTANTGKLNLSPKIINPTIPGTAPRSAPIQSPANNAIRNGTKKR